MKVFINKDEIGTLLREEEKNVFTYRDGAEDVVSVTMPVRAASWVSDKLHPIFQMNLPEGQLQATIKERFGKVKQMDDLGLLEVVGPHVIGRVKYGLPDDNDDGLSLEELLQGDTQALFNELLDRFALRSGISGVQPKVLLDIKNKETFSTDHYIVKSWGEEFPELALNEYLCMTACQKSGLQVPEFSLSENRHMFIMKRFDILDGGDYLGFEDMTVLLGKGTDEKYLGSYEDMLKSMREYVAPRHRNRVNAEVFKALVMNHMLRNGDAHLKNFGILYEKDFTDAQMAPIFDVVTTTTYIEKDIPALEMSGGKLWWKKKTYDNFGKFTCKLKQSQIKEIYDECRQAVKETIVELEAFGSEHPDTVPFLEKLKAKWETGVTSLGFSL